MRFGIREDKERAAPKPLTKKDVFLMSFLAFIVGGLIFSGIFFISGSGSGKAVSDLSGEEEVVQPEVYEVVLQEVPEEEPVVEEIVEEEEEEEIDLSTEYCDEIVSFKEGVLEEIRGVDFKVSIVEASSAYVLIDGDGGLLSTGETREIGGMEIKLTSTSSDVAKIKFVC
jgi:hypothetical protein